MRSEVMGAHAYLSAPYGVYQTKDGYLALAMTPSLQTLCELLQVKGLEQFYSDNKALMSERDVIKTVLAKRIKNKPTADWLEMLQPADIWCSEVRDWEQMRQSEAYKIMDFEQTIVRNPKVNLKALRSPLRIDGKTLKYSTAAPSLGQHTSDILHN